MTQVTAAGLIRTRLDQRLTELQEKYRNIYGADISIDADDMDGEFLGIFAEAISNLDQLFADIYASFDPNAAVGKSLSTLVQLNSIRRIPGAYSYIENGVRVIGTQGTIIQAGSLITNEVDNVIWMIVDSVTIPASGEAIVPLVTTRDMGPFNAGVGQLTRISSPVFGWQSVTNFESAVPGRFEETDEQLRRRRKGSPSTAATAIIDAIYGALMNLPEVRLARVYENQDDFPDSNGQPPHSINAIVEGGTPASIGLVLYLKRSAGATMVGDIEVTVIDSQGFPHTMRFDRPDYVDAYITVNLVKRPGYPTTGAEDIKAALTQYGLDELEIGEDLLNSRLYDSVNTVPNHYITSIWTGVAPGPNTENNITAGHKQLIRIDPSRIVVNET